MQKGKNMPIPSVYFMMKLMLQHKLPCCTWTGTNWQKAINLHT